jgi:hypothetical protein
MERLDLRYPSDAWSEHELESELRRSQIDGVLDLLPAVAELSAGERAVCGECLLLRRITQSRERAARSLLEEAEAELARSVRRVWLSCAEAELVASSSRRACDSAQHQVERLEEELRGLAAERVGLDEEVLDLLRSVLATRAPEARRA